MENLKVNRRGAVKTIGTVALLGSAPTLLNSCAPAAYKPTGNSLKVATLSELTKPGAFKLIQANGAEFMLIRTAAAQSMGVSAGDVHLTLLDRKCTHLGCTVKEPSGGVLLCPCHGSKFNAETGAVEGGVASKPLAAFKLELRGQDIYAVL